MISWFLGTLATRDKRDSKRSSSSSRGAHSLASPHATASRPDRQSPVNSRRLAFSSPILWTHRAVVGTPHTRAGG